MSWTLLAIGLARSPDAYAADNQPSADAVGAPEQPRRDELGDPLPEAALFRLGTTRFQQPHSVVELALSPDGKTVASCGSDWLFAWDASTGKELWRKGLSIRVPSASYGVRPLAFGSDPSTFYTLGADKILKWDLLSGDTEFLSIRGGLKVPMNVSLRGAWSIDVTKDGRKLALGSAAGLIVCDAQGKVLFSIPNRPEQPLGMDGNDRLRFGGDFSYARFSPDERNLALIASDAPSQLRLYDAETGKELRRIQLTSRLVRFAFSPDGRNIATTERDVAARLYAVDTGKEIWTSPFEPDPNAESYTSCIAFSPDGKLLAVGAPIGPNNDIRLLEAKTGAETGRLSGHGWKPWSVAFSSDGKLLYSSGWDGTIRRWDVDTRVQLDLPKGVRATAVVAASPDGRFVAYADDGGTVRLVDSHSGAELFKLKVRGADYSQLVFSPDSRQLAGGGVIDDQVHVVVWDLGERRIVHRWEWKKGRDPHSHVESLHYSPDGKRLAAAVFRQSAAYLWDVTTGRQIAKIDHANVYGLSFAPDGQTLATAGWDRAVRFWSIKDGALVREINVGNVLGKKGDLRMYTVTYARSGGLLATAHLDGVVRIWSAADMSLRAELKDRGDFVYGSICFSPDGLLLATGYTSGEVAVWDLLTEEVVWDAGRHEDHVYTVSFGADNWRLVSGGSEGVCYVWNLAPRGELPNQEPSELWEDLSGGGRESFRAMWRLSRTPGPTVELIAQKLRTVENLMDLKRVTRGLPQEQADRRKRLTLLLAERDERIELLIVARRAVTLLGSLGTPEAVSLLKDLAQNSPCNDLRRMSAAALTRARSSAQQP